MKATWSAWVLLLGILVSQTSIHYAQLPSLEQGRVPASTNQYICKYRAGDIGTVVGRGASKVEAFKDAASQCFDRRIALYEGQSRQSMDMDRGQLTIDSCVNISCEK